MVFTRVGDRDLEGVVVFVLLPDEEVVGSAERETDSVQEGERDRTEEGVGEKLQLPEDVGEGLDERVLDRVSENVMEKELFVKEAEPELLSEIVSVTVRVGVRPFVGEVDLLSEAVLVLLDTD